MSRKTCVFLTPALPSRRGSGLQQRAFAWVVDLACHYDVQLVLAEVSTARDDVRELPKELEPYIARFETVSVRTAPKWLRAIALLFPIILLWKPGWADDWLQGDSFDLALPEEIDQLLLFRMRTLAIGDMIARRCKVAAYAVDLDDVESGTLASIARVALLRGRLKFALHLFAAAWQYKVLEGACLNQVSQIFLSNPDDVDALRVRLPEAEIRSRVNRVAVPKATIVRRLPEFLRLLFVGTLDYFPNIDAVLWIVEEIVPVVRTVLNRPFEVVVAGRGASVFLRERLSKVPEVRFVGEIVDLSALYATSHAALAAVRCGGGTKLKVLEAIAAKCPVLGTTHALRGLPLCLGEEVTVADTPEQVAAACKDLLANPARCEVMTESAYRTLLDRGLVATEQ